MFSEASTLIQLGIVLVILSVLILVVVTLVGFSQNIIQSGMSSTDNAIQAIAASEYDQYDQGTKGGTELLAYLKSKKASGIAIVIKPKNGTKFYNYGALLEGATTTGDETTVAGLTMQSGDTFYTKNLQIPKKSNVNLAKIKVNGDNQFIRGTATYDTYLIKDVNASIVGVLFEQVQ